MSKYFKWAELPPRTDVYTHAGTTTWGNHDLYPIPRKERTWGWLAYVSYQIVVGVTISGYTLASTYIAVGLTVGQTMAAVLTGSIVSAIISYITCRPGLDHAIGFTVWMRTIFGPRGVYLQIFFMCIAGIIFSGLQSYYGGLAFTVMLSAVIPQFAHMKNTLPASAAITTQELIGFLMFFVFYIPMILYVKPYQLRRFMYPVFAIITIIMFGLLIWAIHGNGGSAGSLISSNPTELSTANRAYRIVQCIFSIMGTYGGASERFSDWTRFAKTRQSPTVALLVIMPLTGIFSGMIGALVTSAYYESSGNLVWNPLTLLSDLQANNYSPAVRAGTFFAGGGFFICQLVVNMCNNTVGAGMDISGCLPRYLSIRRAGMFMVIGSIIVQPWRFLSQASVFTEILSIVSIFFSVSCSMLVVDYYFVRKRKLVIPDLYTGGPQSIYWFHNGVNWRAIFCLLWGMWPSLPGLVYTVSGKTLDASATVWTRMFQINYIIGAPLAFITYFAISYFIKPPGLGVQVSMDEQGDVIEGVLCEGSNNGDDKKVAKATEKSAE
ncbi:hypothetical protein BP5796_02058 [Coleophoma crateriformis]|uniref:Uncharacterized protein n=1 Tax=Coleophoma crateriformis TaxID=565419 RepID=A0A3D8T299_9HELO|nr:hypothetical protein BP5796_02058 [Coleophoma crateriformis]